MPFARPSLAALIDRIGGDLLGRLEVDGPLPRRAMARVLSSVWGGAVHGLYGYLDWAVKQLFGDTAEREFLLRIARLYGITIEPAEFATGTVTATGTDGVTIPAGTTLSLDSATKYSVTSDQVIAAGQAFLPLQAVLAGSAGNLPIGTILTFESPIDGVNATAANVFAIEGGVDEEDIEHLRARLLERLREPPEGGADQDYVAWALEAGASRVWVYENELGLGTVVVRFVIDNEDGSITFPDAGQVAAVQAKFDAERPMCAEPTAEAATELDVAFTIHIVPDNANTRAAVSAELDDLLKREGAAGDGAGRGTILLSQIQTAIGNAAGVTDYTLTSPIASVVPALGELAVRGVITWA